MITQAEHAHSLPRNGRNGGPTPEAAAATDVHPALWAIGYGTGAAAWVVVTDFLYRTLGLVPGLAVDTFKGVAFVAVTALLFFALLRRLQRRLLEQRRRMQLLAALARESSDILILEDDSGRIVEINDRAVEAYGRPREELLGRTVDSLQPAGARASVAPDRGPVEGGAQGVYVTEHQATDGRRFEVEVSTRVVEIDGLLYRHSGVRDLSRFWREQELLRLYFDLPFVGMAISSAMTKRWVRVNDEFCRMLGYTREQLEARTWADLTHPDDLDANLQQLDRVIAGELEGYRMRKRYLRADGGLLHADLEVRCVRSPDGAAKYTLATVHDITEQRLAEQRLTRARDLNAMLSRTNSAVARADDELRLLSDVCRIAVESGYFCYARASFAPGGDAAAAASVVEFPPPATASPGASGGQDADDPCGVAIATGNRVAWSDLADVAQPASCVRDALSRGVRSVASEPLRRGEAIVGSLCLFTREPGFFEPDVNATLDEMSRSVSFGIDSLALRRERELAVRAQEEAYLRVRALNDRWASLIEASPAAIFDLDTQGRVRSVWNRAAEDLSGVPAEEAIGRQPPLLHAAEQSVARLRQRALAGETVRGVELTRQRLDGSFVHVSASVAPLRDTTGKVEGVLGVLIDVSDRLRATRALRESEARLRSLNTELEDRILDRTRELLLAKDRAEAADRVKSVFLGTVSHELRTPLNSIIGFADLMLSGMSGPLTAEQHRQLGIVHSAGRQLLALISDFLDISKIEAGAIGLKVAPVLLPTDLRDDIAAFDDLARERGIVLEVRPAEREVVVSADVQRLKQVLGNLLSNALKFTDSGRITLSFEARQREALVVVEDTGIGIPSEHLSSLFEPFKRIEIPGQRDREGTGLGLAIARRLTEAMGGQVGVESVAALGSRFWFTLPLASGDPGCSAC
ncbi:MAG TPA: PAS domain S-box protein [Steroidobacteraceae bacterium]